MPRAPQALEALLRDLGPQLRRGGAGDEVPPRLATGRPPIDALLGGGFPRGRLSEVAGPPSSGRTSLALALLAEVTRRGEVLAVVDAADAFDPASAESAGVALERVLWVRPRPPAGTPALRCAERLLEARGFALVLLDLAAAPPPRIAPAAWPRLARAAAAGGTALLALSGGRLAGSAAELALELRPARAHFIGSPVLLEGLEAEAFLVRGRSQAPHGAPSALLRTRAA